MMVDIVDIVKEKAKDIKDAIADTTKDVVDATKESFSVPVQSSSSSSSSSSTYITPNPTFTSSSITYVPDIEKDNSDIKKSNNVDPLLIGYSENEKKVLSTNIKESNTIQKTKYDSPIVKNLYRDRQQQQYEYKQNDVIFEPFIQSMKLWQDYYIIWMNLYTGMLESFNRTIRNI